MKKTTFYLTIVFLFAATIFSLTQAATGEVTKSGSTFTAKVDGSTVYSGSRYFDAINAACNNAGTGANINIKNSGNSGEDGGNIYAIKPLANQTLNFNGVTVNCNSNGDLICAIYADRRDGITIKNIKVTGNPRYAFWFRGSSDVTLTDIVMDLSNDSPVGLGIRVDASTGSASNLTINGNININGSAGHAIETYSIFGVNIGDVTVTNSGGCGVLLNDSENCEVGVVTGQNNCPNAGYATFRVANSNRKTHCAGVYSRNSGRGFFSVTGSKDCTVDWVDISGTYSQGIYLQDATNTHVLCGVVSDCGGETCLIRGGSGNSINVEGCGGSSCNSSSSSSSSSSGSNGTVNGKYAIIASHSGKALDTYNWGTSNGTNISQWSYWGGDAQHFNISQVDGEWHRISPAISGGQALDIEGVSTADGANIFTWSYWGGAGQQFKFQSAGSGVWRIIARHSEKCIDIAGNSTADGANVQQWTCISGATNQMFQLNKVSSAEKQNTQFMNKEIGIYPNPVSDGQFTIDLSNMEIQYGVDVSIFSYDGRNVFNQYYEKQPTIDMNLELNSGIYVITVKNGKELHTEKITIN